MLPPNIFGTYKYDDLPKIKVEEVTEDQIVESINAYLAAVNAFAAQQTALLVSSGIEVQTKFSSGGGGRFQRAGAVTSVEATITGGNWTIGFPIRSYEDRSQYTQAYLDRATLADLNRDVLDKSLKDVSTQVEEVNRAILTGTNYQFDDDKWPGRRAGNVTVYALANADGTDGEVYVPGAGNAGRVGIGGLNHYITSGSNSVTVDAFKMARAALRNVGNDDDIVYVCSKADADEAEELPDFVRRADPNIVTPNGQYALVSSPRARGRIAKGEVWEWPHWPDNYIFAFDRSKPKPVRQRLPDLQKYQGLQITQPDGLGEIPGRPLVNKYWRRICGYGIYNRVNGVVVQTTTSGTYTAPSAFI